MSAARREAIARDLARLDPADRTLLALRYVEQLSDAEIAALLGVPVAVVRRRLQAGVARLASHARAAMLRRVS